MSILRNQNGDPGEIQKSAAANIYELDRKQISAWLLFVGTSK